MKRLWNIWKTFAERIGNFNARLFYTVFYFIILPLFALGVKFISDPLKLKKKWESSNWVDIREKKISMKEIRRQF